MKKEMDDKLLFAFCVLTAMVGVVLEVVQMIQI